MARFVAIAIMLAIGAAIYAFMQTSNLKVANLRLAGVEQELADLKKRTTTSASEVSRINADLTACHDQVTTLQTSLDEAMKKKPGKR